MTPFFVPFRVLCCLTHRSLEVLTHLHSVYYTVFTVSRHGQSQSGTGIRRSFRCTQFVPCPPRSQRGSSLDSSSSRTWTTLARREGQELIVSLHVGGKRFREVSTSNIRFQTACLDEIYTFTSFQSYPSATSLRQTTEASRQELREGFRAAPFGPPSEKSQTTRLESL